METEVIKTVGVVVFSKDLSKVLLVEHLKKAEQLSHTYGVPAGRLGDEEKEIECAVRELKEETGLISTPENLIKLPFYYEAAIPRKDGKVLNFGLRTFLCTQYSGKPHSGKENRPVWIEVDKIDNLNLLPNQNKVVIDALNYKNNLA